MLRTIIFFLQQAGYIAPTVEAGVTALFLSFSSIFTLLLYFGPKFYLLKHGDAAATRNASRFGSNVSCWESANAPTGISGQRSANYSYNVAAPRSTAISSTEEEEEAPAATTVVRFSGVTEPLLCPVLLSGVENPLVNSFTQVTRSRKSHKCHLGASFVPAGLPVWLCLSASLFVS